ncbi:hypothetical protein CRUP_035608 [Coryphaenoides rupestris]|nr:hypothetical protein CRUP_035608 [Coryphaenoides rupestris]
MNRPLEVASWKGSIRGNYAHDAPPQFTKTPTDQIGVSGGVASFVCQASGDPKPQVVWNKKGKKVNSQRIETVEYDEGAGAVLRIQPLRAPRDENVYECVAQNSHGEKIVTAKLAIIRGSALPANPTPVSHPHPYPPPPPSTLHPPPSTLHPPLDPPPCIKRCF